MSKIKRKDIIDNWIYEEARKYANQFKGRLSGIYEDAVIEGVYKRAREEGFGISCKAVSKRYDKKRKKILRRIRKENAEEVVSERLERVNFMNMCMIRDRNGNVLALDKVGDRYSGTTFPGGHMEPGETFADAVIREVKEETGLLITGPKLKGIYHWYRDGVHNVGLLYLAENFEGGLSSSEEGRVYWIPETEYAKKDLAHGMNKVLEIMNSDSVSECFFKDGVEIIR